MSIPNLPSRGSYTNALGGTSTGSYGGFGESTWRTPTSVPVATLEVAAKSKHVMKAINDVANNSPQWNAFVTKLAGQISSAIAVAAVSKIKKVLQDSTQAASLIGQSIKNASPLTMALRNQNTKSTAALKDSGSAARNVKITPTRGGGMRVDFGARSRVMYYLETGYTLTATAKFLRYATYKMNKWLQVANVRRGDLGAAGRGLGGHAMKKASAWLAMASLKEGHSYSVPARPVVRPAIAKAKEEFLQNAGTGRALVEAIGRAMFDGKYHVTIGNSRSGVSLPGRV